MLIQLFEHIFNYIRGNPLELPAFLISIFSFLIARKKLKSEYARIIFERIPTYHQLKIYPPSKGQSLSIVNLPSIHKKVFIFYKKLDLLVDYNVEVDMKANENVQNIYYIFFEQFSTLEKGKYLIKVKVDCIPYRLKYKFSLPIVDPVKNVTKTKFNKSSINDENKHV